MDEDVVNDQDAVIEFANYEDFLDSQISTLDLYYLEVGFCFRVPNFRNRFLQRNIFK